MRYNINARLIYDATDGTLTLPYKGMVFFDE